MWNFGSHTICGLLTTPIDWLPGPPPPLPPQFDDSFLWEAAASTGSKISCSVRPTAWTMSRASTLGSRHAPVEAAFFSLKEKYGD